MNEVREGELVFDFGTAAVERFDLERQAVPKCMQAVDFVVADGGQLYFVEIKDPSNIHAKVNAQETFLAEIKSNVLVDDHLVPKARNTYLYLHLMGCDNPVAIYVVVLGLHALKIEQPHMTRLAERLRGRLRQEADIPWLRPYVSTCVVVTPETFSRHFPDYSVRRESAVVPA